MRIRSFENEIFIAADVTAVMRVVSDYSQQQMFHPLIVKVVQATTAPDGILKRYFITDRLRWGPFAVKIVYRTDILSISKDTVHATAYQFPGIAISMISMVTRTNEGVLLRETFTLRAPTLFFEYAFEQAKMAHEEALRRIKNYLEGLKPGRQH